MDGTVFPKSLWGNEQKEPFDLQGVSGGKLQATDSQSTFTRYQQVSRIHETRETESEVRKGTTKELLRKRNQ